LNYRIHGISAEEYLAGPTLPEIFGEVIEFIGNSILVAHNASFDRSCLNRTAQSWGLEIPLLDWRCTYQLSKQYLDLPYYKLPMVAESLDLRSFKHHDSLEDALVCAEIAIHIADANSLVYASEFPVPSASGNLSNKRPEGAGTLENIGESNYPDENLIRGLNMSFTGTLTLGERESLLVPLIESLGGMWNKDPKSSTDLLVFGDRDPNYLRAGMEKSKKLEKAELLREKLGRIEIIDEATFLSLIPGDVVTRLRSNL
jgi:DNA polymerase-3 subunit epsilon